MEFFEPLSFFMVLVAISLEWLGNTAVYLLDLPEWRVPREYIRSEYEPCEFCSYLVRWALDSRDTTFVFGTLLFLLCLLLALGYWFCQRPLLEWIALKFENANLRSDFETSKEECETLTADNHQLRSDLVDARDDSKTSHQVSKHLYLTGAETAARSGHLEGKVESLGEALAETKTRLAKRDEELAATKARLAERDEELARSNKQARVTVRIANRARARQQKSKVRIIGNLKAARDADRNTAQKREQKLEQEVKDVKAQAASDKQKLKDKLSEAVRSNKLLKEQHSSDRKTLEGKVTAAETEKKVLKDELETTKSIVSDLEQQSCQAVADARFLGTELAAAQQETQAEKDKGLVLRDAAEQNYVKLQQEKKTLEAAKTQQGEAFSKLAGEHKKLRGDYSEATERTNTLQRENEQAKKLQGETGSKLQRVKEELAAAIRQIQNKDVEITTARRENAERVEELQQELQSKQKVQQDKLDKAQSVEEELRKQVVDCQDALKRTRDSKDKQTMDDRQKHKVALDEKEEEHKEVIRSKNARIDQLEDCVREPEETTADHDKNMKRTLSSLQTAESRLQNTEKDLKATQAELKDMQKEAAGRLKQATDAYAAANKQWNEIAALKAENKELVGANTTLAKERQTALGAQDEAQSTSDQTDEEEDDDDDDQDEDDEDDDAGDQNAGAPQPPPHNDGEGGSRNDDSGNPDESNPTEKKKRGPRVRAGKGGRLQKAMTALYHGESVDGMVLNDTQRHVVEKKQEEALRALQTDPGTQQTSVFKKWYRRNQQQQPTHQVVGTNASPPAVDPRPQSALVATVDAFQPATNPMPFQPQVALVATANEFRPAAIPTSLQMQAALVPTASEFQPVSTIFQPPQQRVAGLTGDSQHQPSGQTLQPPQQRVQGLSGSQHQHEQHSQPPQPRVQGLNGSSRWQ